MHLMVCMEGLSDTIKSNRFSWQVFAKASGEDAVKVEAYAWCYSCNITLTNYQKCTNKGTPTCWVNWSILCQIFWMLAFFSKDVALSCKGTWFMSLLLWSQSYHCYSLSSVANLSMLSSTHSKGMVGLLLGNFIAINIWLKNILQETHSIEAIAGVEEKIKP